MLVRRGTIELFLFTGSVVEANRFITDIEIALSSVLLPPSAWCRCRRTALAVGRMRPSAACWIGAIECAVTLTAKISRSFIIFWRLVLNSIN